MCSSRDTEANCQFTPTVIQHVFDYYGIIKFYLICNYSVWHSDRAGSRCVITNKRNNKATYRRTDTPAAALTVRHSALSDIAPSTLSTLQRNVKCPVHVMEA